MKLELKAIHHAPAPAVPTQLARRLRARTTLNAKRDVKVEGSRRSILLGGFCPCCCGFCKPKDGWYDRFFAHTMATGMDAYEEAAAPFKFELLSRLGEVSGPQRILDVGIGAAPNLPFLASLIRPQELQVTGVDPNPFMFEYANATARASGVPEEALDLKIGVAEELPVEDAIFDAVICSLVLCSVSDVRASVKEMKRVLKPGGRVFFLEHVLAAQERPLLRLTQQVLSPVQQVLADGCHLNRNPLDVFRDEGFSKVDAKLFDVPGMGPIAPHVSGVATA